MGRKGTLFCPFTSNPHQMLKLRENIQNLWFEFPTNTQPVIFWCNCTDKQNTLHTSPCSAAAAGGKALV